MGERVRMLRAQRPMIGLLGVLLSVIVGMLIARFPPFAVLVVAGVLGALVVVFRNAVPRVFFAVLPVVLGGYALLGRGFAYLGAAPVYVGEMAMGLAALTVVVSLPRARLTRLHGLLIAFMVWGALRTMPYVPRYGLDALRDAVLWGYALFAVAVSFAARGDTVQRLADRYRRVLPALVLWVPLAGVLTYVASAAVPRLPGSGVPIVAYKGGDMGVHLAGMAAFLLLGLAAARPTGLWELAELFVWPAWFLGLFVAGAVNRGGLLAASAGAGLAMLLRPSRRGAWLIWVALLLLCAGLLINPSVSTERGREFSLRQVASNALSVVGVGEESTLNSTKEWRLAWWETIIDYTIKGPYFLTGKGFGINLADDDGFQVMADHSLRSPHNGHLTVLARMGVPGFALWIAFHAAFGIALLRAARRAMRRGDTRWAAIELWLLIYWLAMMLNASFDVYLEGPQGGIWFWSIVGLGLAALAVERSAPATATPAAVSDVRRGS